MDRVLPRLGPLSQRIIALALLALAALFLGQWIVLPGTHWLFDHGRALSLAEDRYERFASVAAELPGLEANAIALREAERSGGYVLVDLDTTAASASLQGRVREIVSEAGAQVTALRSSEAIELDELELSRISANVQIRCNTEQLVGILSAMEQALPVLNIEQIVIRNLSARPGRETRDDDLRVDLIVSGFWADREVD